MRAGQQKNTADHQYCCQENPGETRSTATTATPPRAAIAASAPSTAQTNRGTIQSQPNLKLARLQFGNQVIHRPRQLDEQSPDLQSLAWQIAKHLANATGIQIKQSKLKLEFDLASELARRERALGGRRLPKIPPST